MLYKRKNANGAKRAGGLRCIEQDLNLWPFDPQKESEKPAEDQAQRRIARAISEIALVYTFFKDGSNIAHGDCKAFLVFQFCS